MRKIGAYVATWGILCKGRAPNRVNFYCGMLVYIIQRHSDCYHVYVERTQSCTGIQLTGEMTGKNRYIGFGAKTHSLVARCY